MSANDELQAHTCEKMLEFYEKPQDYVKKSHNEQDLTEKWKKGELEKGYYYVKGIKKYDGINVYWIGYPIHESERRWIEEVLAPVLSYEEWVYLHKARNDAHEIVESLTQENKQLRKWCEEFNALDVAKENQQLKELLKEVRDAWVIYKPYDRNQLCKRIVNAIGEKK